MKAVAVDPKHRATLDELLQMDFIKLSRRKDDGLAITPLEDTNLNELRCNMYKFNVAHCFDEIIWRFRLNQSKQKAIRMSKHLFEAKNTVKEAVNAYSNALQQDGALIHSFNIQRADSLSLSGFEHSMVDYFGEFEAKRITQYFKKNDYISVTFPEAYRSATNLFDEDLEEIIS